MAEPQKLDPQETDPPERDPEETDRLLINDDSKLPSKDKDKEDVHDNNEEDSELASRRSRRKGGETIEEELELVPLPADTIEDDLELDSKKKEDVHDNNEEDSELASRRSEEVHDDNEEDSELAIRRSGNRTKQGETNSEDPKSDPPTADQKKADSEVDSKDKDKNKYKWIQENIKMRKCKTFIFSHNRNKTEICKCGYKISEHQSTNPTNESTELEWKCLTNTESVATNAFGEMKFVKNGGNIAKFVRVDRETRMSTMWKLMTKVWGMTTPNMLISVTGSTGICKIKSELKYTFQRNLMKAASSTGAWIITGATHTGVTKFVGDAVKDYRLTSAKQRDVFVLGIVPWGVIQNKQSLLDAEGVNVAQYSVGEENVSKKSFLDPNHSYFIMVDDGTQHKYGTEITFRANLEHKISEMKPSDGNADRIGLGSFLSFVPTVILILSGGTNALETVQNALKQNTPAVIIKGSGGAADILAEAYRLGLKFSNKNNETEIESQKRKIDKITEHMKRIKFCSDEDNNANIKRIQECIAKSDLLHIFEWNSGSGAFELDTAILKALLKAKKIEMTESLALAIVWDKFDFARSKILTDQFIRKDLANIMLLAIQMNRVNFVELFLDMGMIGREFLSTKRLLQLYENGSSRLILMLLNRMRLESNERQCSERITLKEVGRLMKYLLGDYQTLDKYEHKYEKDNPEKEIFLWSVLNNQQEMAKFFWRQGEDTIATALVASALYDAMSRRVHDRELIEKLKKNASDFTDLAIEVVNESHRIDESKVQSLMIRRTMWVETSCIMIAVETKNQRFISQTECTELFLSIWNGNLREENSTWKLLLCTVCPLLIPLLVSFKENGNGVDEENNSVQKQKSKGSSTRDKDNGNQPSQGKQEAKAAKSKIKANIWSYYKAPVVIFCHNVISYLMFLLLYSYILLYQLKENWTVQEFILIGWVFTILTEEIRQICAREDVTIRKSYIRDGWNMIDILTISLFAIGMLFRCSTMPEIIEASRVILGVDLIMFFTRLLHTFCLHKELGPKLAMIIQTLQSMIYFLVILMVFVVAYAIASQAILYPNAELNLDNAIAIFLRPYWNIYGDLMLERFEEGADDCPDDLQLYRDGTYSHCPSKSGKYFGELLMAVYMLICNTLLLNLLIIMFGNTYEKIQTNIDMYFNLQLLSLIREYQNRPLLPPPIIIIEHACQLIRSCCPSNTSSKEDGLTKDKDIRKFEKKATQEPHRKRINTYEYDEETNPLHSGMLLGRSDGLQKQRHKIIIETIKEELKYIEERLEETLQKQQQQQQKMLKETIEKELKR